ncbi:hypothetical protein LOTGIDRAFT_161267 [Lottia gigantea]|uniref:Uncharacterized protein n=1 Tax=Lottia gigantea TaxID=225164 RepID=V4AHA6_LOTGI|nr:hypothetical protein LOTGIDRAFT_161267 [Lottia gigantea]ESO94565.1 hypothetical protein LOTGIDRAFT_161267 [Lottia gigantea]
MTKRPLSIDTDCTDNSMELSPTSPSTGFTKYGVRVSPKPFSSLSNSSSPKSLSDGLASIKESKYSPVAPPTRKVSVDKTSDSVNGSSNGSASVEYPFRKDEPTSNGAKSVPFPFDKSEPSVKSVNKTSENQNGLSDELVIKTDSSIGSSPIMSPQSPAALSPALSPRSDSGDSGIEKAPKPVKKPVHSSNIYVNKNQNNPAKKLGIDIPKSHAESKIIAATWGKETDEVTSPQPVKNPPPVAPKPKSRSAKAPLPDPPKRQVETQKSVETPIQSQKSNDVESQPPLPTTRQKSPGVETLKLNDKLKRFETEIQRQTDLAKPSGPPQAAARRTSSSSEHSTASLRSSSPDRDVFLSDEKKSSAPTMVYSTTVKSKGDLPKDQDKSYSMKITNQENSLEITRTEVRKQSVEEPKRKTSSGSNPSPLSPSSPFYQDLTEKPVKVNPVRLNRALAPKGSSQNQNVEINSTVKLTAPSHPPPETKPKPKAASWFAGKESNTITTNTECTSPTPSSVVCTEPHLIFESPKCKSPRNKGTKKSPSDSMNSPTSPREQLVPSDTASPIPGVKLEYVSPKSPKRDMQRKFSQEEIQTKFDDLLNLDSEVEKTIVESTTENKSDVPVKHEEITTKKVESAALNVNNSALVNNTEDVKVDDIDMTLDDSCESIKEDAIADSKVQTIEKEDKDSEQTRTDDRQKENTEGLLVDHVGTVIPDSVVEPYAAALVEKVIDSAKECIMNSEEDNHPSTKNAIHEPLSEDKMVADDTTLVKRSAPALVGETLIPEAVESVQTRPDILSDVQTKDETNEVSKIVPEPVASETESERSSSPPPLPSSAPPPLPSSPPPTAIPPPTLLPSFEDPPDLVDFMTGSIIKPPSQFTDPQPDIVHSSPIIPEDEIKSMETKTVAAAPNLIEDIAPSALPDVTNDNSAINEIESRDPVESERRTSEVETGILDDSVGSSVDPVEDQLTTPQSDSLLNTARNSQHDNVTSPQESSEADQTSTTLVDTVTNSTMPNQTNSTDLNVVKDSKNDLLDSNENLFSAKPVIISSDEPEVSNSASSIQVSSFQESLPRTDQDDTNNKIYSSTPAKSLGTPTLVATDIDIDSSFKSDISNDTLLDNTNNSEYVNISMTSNGPDVTNEALKISSSSTSKRDWTFVTSDKDTSVIEGKANVSFEFLDFTNVSLIEPEELKCLVDQANQTMDRTGVSSSNQIIVVLLHRNEPTDKVGLELMKGSQGKVIVSMTSLL